MITVGVASILMALAVPSFNQMIVSSRLTAQSNDVLAAITLARSEAIKRNGSVTLCRADTSTATDCSSSAGVWQNWIIRAGTGTVVRQGTVNNFGGTLVMRSTLTNDQLVFGADGLARTNGAVVTNRAITVCSVRRIDNNLRRILLAAGSRMSTQLDNTTTCT